MSVFLLSSTNTWQLMPNGVTQGDYVRWQDPVGNEYVVPSHKKVYQLALVGYGSSIAYYINAFRQRSTQTPGFKWSRTVIIGTKDAWQATIRGEGFINHENHNIAQWSDKVPKFTQKYLPRQDWVAQNGDVLAWAVKQGATRTGSSLKSVSRAGDLFALNVGGGQPILAAKVILGMGAGPHFSFPYERYVPQPAEGVRDDSEAMDFLRSRVINLDRFMLLHRENAVGGKKGVGLTVIIHGANAGIDAVQRAAEHGYSIYLFRSEEPAWLSGNRLSVSPTKSRLDLDIPEDDEDTDVTEVKVSARDDKVTVSPSETEGKVQVDIEFKTENEQETSYEVDFYVPALGQNPMDTGAVGDVLKQGGLCWADLEPIYDKDQIFGLPYQTVLGLQVKGTTYGRGLQIIGAAAESLAGARPDEAALLKGGKATVGVQHNYREQFSFTPPENDDETLQEQQARESTVDYVEKHIAEAEGYLKEARVGLLLQHQVDATKVPDLGKVFPLVKPKGLSTPQKPAATAIASVLAAAQLGAVRCAAAALHNMIPDHIVNGSGSNFTTDDRTMLAVYIASEFPHIPPKVAESIVEQIVKGRRIHWQAKPEQGLLASTRIGYNEEQSEQIMQWLRDENEAWWTPLSQARRTSEKEWKKLWDTAAKAKVFNVAQ